MREIIAQALGVVGVGVFLLCFQAGKMKNVLKIKLLVDIIWGLHYLFLGAYSAFGTNVVCCLRELVFMNKDKKFFRGRVWLWVFVGFNMLSAALTWQSWYSLIPAVCGSLATFSFWQDDVRRARWIAISNNVLMFTYDIVVSSYTGMVAELLACISVFIAIFRYRVKLPREEKAE